MSNAQAKPVIAKRHITKLRPMTVYVKLSDGSIYSRAFSDDWYAYSHVLGNEIRFNQGWIEKRAAA